MLLTESMDIYGVPPRVLPQVTVTALDQEHLYRFLKLFERSYADFIRDVCEILGQLRMDEGGCTFTTLLGKLTQTIMQTYQARGITSLNQLAHSQAPNMYEALELHHYPIKRLARLPTVSVSGWQAEHLIHFLTRYHRTYADFVRCLCRYLHLDTLDAQSGRINFRGTTQAIVNKLLEAWLELRKSPAPSTHPGKARPSGPRWGRAEPTRLAKPSRAQVDADARSEWVAHGWKRKPGRTLAARSDPPALPHRTG